MATHLYMPFESESSIQDQISCRQKVSLSPSFFEVRTLIKEIVEEKNSSAMGETPITRRIAISLSSFGWALRGSWDRSTIILSGTFSALASSFLTCFSSFTVCVAAAILASKACMRSVGTEYSSAWSMLHPLTSRRRAKCQAWKSVGPLRYTTGTLVIVSFIEDSDGSIVPKSTNN